MKLFKNHKKRVEKIKDFIGKNKVFVITMIVAVIFLLFNFVFVPKNKDNSREERQQAGITEESDGDTGEPAAEKETWRFYFIDVIILGAGGGFCLIMILRERLKTKQKI